MVAAAEPAVRWIDTAPSDGARRNRPSLAHDLAVSRRSLRVGQPLSLKLDRGCSRSAKSAIIRRHFAKTLNPLRSGFRSAAPHSDAQRLCCPSRRCSHRTLFPWPPLRAGSAVPYSTTRDHCAKLRIFLRQIPREARLQESHPLMHKVFALLQKRSGCQRCLWQSGVLVVYAQAQWTGRESRRSTQFIRFRTEP
jgi:hypothetical protein